MKGVDLGDKADDQVRVTCRAPHVFVELLKSRVFELVLGIMSIKSFRQRPHDSFKRHQRHCVRRESPIDQSVSDDRVIIIFHAP